MGWNLAMQENIDDDMLVARLLLRRARLLRRDADRPARLGPARRRRSATSAVLVASGIAYAAICGLVLCSRSVRDLPRAPATPVAEVTTGTS